MLEAAALFTSPGSELLSRQPWGFLSLFPAFPVLAPQRWGALPAAPGGDGWRQHGHRGQGSPPGSLSRGRECRITAQSRAAPPVPQSQLTVEFVRTNTKQALSTAARTPQVPIPNTTNPSHHTEGAQGCLKRPQKALLNTCVVVKRSGIDSLCTSPSLASPSPSAGIPLCSLCDTLSAPKLCRKGL